MEVETCVANRGCKRIYLTSEPENVGAHATWSSLGFENMFGDYISHGISVTKDFKGPGKDRAVYERWIKQGARLLVKY